MSGARQISLPSIFTVSLTLAMLGTSCMPMGFQKPPKFEQNAQPLAKIDEFTGDVRVCRAGNVNWEKVKKAILLYPADRVFTGKGGIAILQFNGQESARVMLNSGSIFVVGDELPISFHLAKSVTPPKLEWTRELKNEDGGGGGGEADFSNVSSGVRLEMSVVVENFIDPRGNVLVHGSKWPLEINLSLPSDSKHLMYGVLWKNAEKSGQIWHSLDTGRRFKVPLPAPGQYVFQGFDDAHRWRTVPVLIEARQTELADLGKLNAPLLPKNLVAGDTVVLP